MILRKVTRGVVDSGMLLPSANKAWSKATPISIKKATLSPMARTNFSTNANLFSFNKEMSNSPGIVVKRVNPKSCLKMGMSRRTARSAAMRNTINRRNLRALEFFNDFITYGLPTRLKSSVYCLTMLVILCSFSTYCLPFSPISWRKCSSPSNTLISSTS